LVNPFIESARQYYASKFNEFGATHRGADWNSVESQELRFTQLLKVCEGDLVFELNDLGCGYAALYHHLKKMAPKATYYGYDICAEMIQAARRSLGAKPDLQLFEGNQMQMADYTVASGVLHVKQSATDEQWLDYIQATIDQMNKASRKGFAFNLLTKYSDPDKMRSDLYYADPCYFFDYLKRNIAFNVAVLHDYGLWEFTLVAKKG
jgi:SAM-dependent methyltransferase